MSHTRAWHPAAGILLLTAVALAVNGYHLGVDDAEIYVPAIKLAADPSLFPAGSAFFMQHASLTIFPNLIGLSARLLRLPIDWAIFLWYVISLFLLFAASGQFLRSCFQSERARWAGLCVLTAALAVPVAGTALLLVDPYLTPRSLSTPAALFAAAAFARNRTRAAVLWVLVATVVHPQMGAYAIAALGWMAIARVGARPLASFAPARADATMWAFPVSFELEPAHGIYKEILQSRAYFLVSNWQWYEWVGVIAPLALLGWFSRMRLPRTKPAFQIFSGALIPYAVCFTLMAIVFASAPQFENVARLQPMRCFHLVYLVMFLVATLVDRYGVQWFVIPEPEAVPGLTCPYQNHDFRVCTIAEVRH